MFFICHWVSSYFHDISATLPTETAQTTAQPHYQGNLNQAIKNLNEKTITEQQLLQAHMITN